MSRTMRCSLGCVGIVAFAAGCASTPAAPFDQMKMANVMVYRLQNAEPPAAPIAAIPQAMTPGGLLPQIQQGIQQGAQALQQILPPGLVPPGLLQQPGTTPAAAATGVTDTTPRFPVDTTPNYRILGQTQVMDEELRVKLSEVLGDADNFASTSACMYPDLGISFTTAPSPANNILVSMGCGQVMARNFQWPHPATGLKDGAVKDLREVIGKIFPPGA